MYHFKYILLFYFLILGFNLLAQKKMNNPVEKAKKRHYVYGFGVTSSFKQKSSIVDIRFCTSTGEYKKIGLSSDFSLGTNFKGLVVGKIDVFTHSTHTAPFNIGLSIENFSYDSKLNSYFSPFFNIGFNVLDLNLGYRLSKINEFDGRVYLSLVCRPQILKYMIDPQYFTK
jgi:hypothetical protein